MSAVPIGLGDCPTLTALIVIKAGVAPGAGLLILLPHTSA